MYFQLRTESQVDTLLIFTIIIVLLLPWFLISKWTYDIYTPLPLWPEKQSKKPQQLFITEQEIDIFTDMKNSDDDDFVAKLSIPQDIVSQIENTLDDINDMRSRRGKYRDHSKSVHLMIKKQLDSDIASRIINTVTEIRFLKDDMVNGISIVTFRQVIGLYSMNSLGSASKFDCSHENLQSFVGSTILKMKQEKITYCDDGGTIISKKIRIEIETDHGLLRFRLIGGPMGFLVFWNHFQPGYF